MTNQSTNVTTIRSNTATAQEQAARARDALAQMYAYFSFDDRHDVAASLPDAA